MRRPGARLIGVAILGLLLAGCAAELPASKPDPSPAVPPPVLEVAQAQEILTEVGEVLAAGQEALDPALLSPRVTGPALASLTAEYAVATATKDASVITEVPTEAQALIVSDAAQWPRTIMVVTEQPEDLQSPRLLVLRQATARSQYALWGWARLLPGAQMPPTADPSIGSVALEPDAAGFQASPAEVVAQYADVLANGEASEFAGAFAADVAREAIAAAREAFRPTVEGSGGQFAQTYTPADGELFSFATADGGALVIGGLRTTTAVTVHDSTVNLSPNIAALLGKAEITSTMTMTWTDVLAISVPAAGSEKQITVLAAEHVLTDVTGE